MKKIYHTKEKCKQAGHERCKIYYENNKESIAEQHKEYRANNRDKILQDQKEYYNNNLEKFKEHNKEYYATHAKELNRKAKFYSKQKTITLKLEVYRRITNGKVACQHCGFEDVRALQIDHINGGGSKSRRLGSITKYKRLLALSDTELKSKYQLLCANCNWIKRVENNEIVGVL